MMLGDASAVYLMPIAPPGSRGGPDFPDGAYDQTDCREEKIDIPFSGKQPLIPPPGSLPPDVRDIRMWAIKNWNGHDGWGTATVTRCGQRRQCLEALYDRVTGKWYCAKLGAPCGGQGEPACAPVPEDARYTWTDDFVQGRKKVHATPEGDPIFEPAAPPGAAVPDAATAGSSNLLVWGGVAAAALALYALMRR